MSEPMIEFTPFEEGTLLSLVDENGQETEFEALATLTVDGKTYIGLTPREDNNANTDMLVILQNELNEEGETICVTVDSDEEYDRIGNLMIEYLNDYYFDEDAEEE